jgi:hypothetical protein
MVSLSDHTTLFVIPLSRLAMGTPHNGHPSPPIVFWADHVTTRKTTGHTPFFLAHDIEPLLPFDIVDMTFLLPNIDGILSTDKLLTIHSHQLAK